MYHRVLTTCISLRTSRTFLVLPDSHINTERIKKLIILLLREFHAAAELFFGGASVGDRVNYPCPLSKISTEDGNLREFDLCGDSDDDDNIDKRNQEHDNQVIKITQIIVSRYCQCCGSALVLSAGSRSGYRRAKIVPKNKNKM